MGSRTRQTRAIVSYRVDDSSDESDDDVPFSVPRSAKDDGFRNGEEEAGNSKGRRSLALKKNRSQDRGEARELERAHRGQPDQNRAREDLKVSTKIVQSELIVGNVFPETKTAAVQRLVDVAFEATDAKIIDAYDYSGGAVEEGRQVQSPAVGGESAQPPPELKSDVLQGDGREPNLASERTLLSVQEESLDTDVGAIDTVRPLSRKSSENPKALSDDDDWLLQDVVNGDSSDSASDFSSEDASDSDLDTERPAKKRQSTKAAAKKPPPSASCISVTKGPRSRSSGADRKLSGSMQKIESKKPSTKSVGRPRMEIPKFGNPSAGPSRSLVEGTGVPACIPRLQPAKIRLKMASKETVSDGSLCGPSGGVPAQLISPNNLHRRVLGLSRRYRPPPLHPYLAGT